MLTEFCFFFFSTLLTFLNLISNDIGAFLFTLIGQNISHCTQEPTKTPHPPLHQAHRKKKNTGWTVSAGWWFQCLFTNQSIIHRQASMRKIILYQHSNAIDCLLAISRKRHLSQFHGLMGKRRTHGVAVTWLSQTLNNIRDSIPYLKLKKKKKKEQEKKLLKLIFTSLSCPTAHKLTNDTDAKKKLWK